MSSESIAQQDSRGSRAVELPVESTTGPLRLSWQGRMSLDASLLRGMSGRLRAGIVMGLRLHRDASLASAVALRILGRIDRGR